MKCTQCTGTISEGREIRTQRTGGGTYRRGGRWYRTTICENCAWSVLKRAHGYAGETVSRLSVASTRRALNNLMS